MLLPFGHSYAGSARNDAIPRGLVVLVSVVSTSFSVDHFGSGLLHSAHLPLSTESASASGQTMWARGDACAFDEALLYNQLL